MSGQWYLVFRYVWQRNNLVREQFPCDGCFASNAEAAAEIAAGRVDYRTDEKLVAMYCNTSHHRQYASELNDRHVCDWWGEKQFNEWFNMSAYDGDYLRKKVES